MHNRQKIINEIYWLLGIGAIAAAIEYAIIVLMDLHPILSVKVQAFIGLLVVAYIIRMVARVWKYSDSEVGSEADSNNK